MLTALAAVPGCEKCQEDKQSSPLVVQDTEFLLVIVLDVSGSFIEYVNEDSGKAYYYILSLIDKFFRNRLGSDDKIVLAQLSATDKSLLWDGSPRTLRQSFPDAKAFRKFMLERSNPNGSRVHDGIADALDYVMDYPGVAAAKTKSAIFVLSDMDDNFPNPEQSKARLVKALSDYSCIGGAIGIYWCDQSLVPVWRKHLRQSGIRSWVVESEIVADPTVPSFD